MLGFTRESFDVSPAIKPQFWAFEVHKWLSLNWNKMALHLRVEQWNAYVLRTPLSTSHCDSRHRHRLWPNYQISGDSSSKFRSHSVRNSSFEIRSQSNNLVTIHIDYIQIRLRGAELWKRESHFIGTKNILIVHWMFCDWRVAWTIESKSTVLVHP